MCLSVYLCICVCLCMEICVCVWGVCVCECVWVHVCVSLWCVCVLVVCVCVFMCVWYMNIWMCRYAPEHSCRSQKKPWMSSSTTLCLTTLRRGLVLILQSCWWPECPGTPALASYNTWFSGMQAAMPSFLVGIGMASQVLMLAQKEFLPHRSSLSTPIFSKLFNWFILNNFPYGF